jgi:secondary thiamine-phosphate synthase enzyme
MRLFARELVVSSSEPLEFIDLTDRVAAAAAAGTGAVERGLLHLFCLHTTAALLLGEFQHALLHDMRSQLSRLVDEHADYRHNRPEFSDCERRNAAAHLRGSLLQPALCLAVVGGQPVLGRYQRIVLVELDGPRERRLHLQLLGVGA